MYDKIKLNLGCSDIETVCKILWNESNDGELILALIIPIEMSVIFQEKSII